MRRLAVIVCALAIVPSTTRAQETAPPGNSGISQYYESVPSAGGGQTPASGSDRPLPSRTERELRAAGSEGEALVSALERAPGPEAARKAGESGSAARPGEAAGPSIAGFEDDSQAAAPPASIVAPLVGESGPSGSGLLLPIFLIVTALGATLLGFRRAGPRRAAR